MKVSSNHSKYTIELSEDEVALFRNVADIVEYWKNPEVILLGLDSILSKEEKIEIRNKLLRLIIDLSIGLNTEWINNLIEKDEDSD